MKLLNLLLLCCFMSSGFSALSQDIIYQRIIDDFKENYSNGEVSNFYDIARLLDVNDEMFDPLGYHHHTSLVREVAARHVRENTLFKGVNLDSILISKASFENFLNVNRPKIMYSSLIDSYLNEPLKNFSEEHQIVEKKEQIRISPVFLNALETENMGVKREDFTNEVDFYGTLLKETHGFNDFEFIPKILHHLMLTKDPKALLYIASEPYRLRHKFNSSSYNEHYYDFMSAYTDVTVKVKNKEGVFTFFLKDDDFNNVKSKNYLFYWVQHYNDYEWDEQKGLFVNTKEQGRTEPILNTYFSNLYAEDSKLARASFEMILKSDVSEVNRLLKDYKLGSYGSDKVNDTLPSFLDRRIRALVVLEKFYNEIQLDYEMNSKLFVAISQLKSAKNYEVKIAIENTLIQTLTFEEISKLEYFVALERHHLGERNSINNSVSRVFDYFYSENLNEIIKSKVQLRSYLKKAVAFDRFGIIGAQNLYLRKFKNISEKQKGLLKALLEEENDIDIIMALKSVLGLIKINSLHLSKENYYLSLVKAQSPDSIKKGASTLNYLISTRYRKHKYFRFSNSNDSFLSKTLNLSEQEIIEIDSLYQSNFSNENLLDYFESNLVKKDSLTELDFNRLYGYKDYEKNVDRNLLLKIKKGVNVSDIGFNKLPLDYFVFLVNYTEKAVGLDELLDSLDPNSNPIEVLNICFQFANRAEDKADFFEYLINYSNLIGWLKAVPNYLSKQDEIEILKPLEAKIMESEAGSFDFRTFTEAHFIFEHRNKSLKERIREAAKIEDPKIKKNLVVEALIKARKDEFIPMIEVLIENRSLLSDYNRKSVVNDGLGVPSTTYDIASLRAIIDDYRIYDRKVFFRRIVQKTYPEAFKEDQLTLKEAYRILSFDNVLGFIGGQGGDRNDGVKALIRLLEEEFQTDLGFQYNLRYLGNNTVTSLRERCKAWAWYLKKNEYVVDPPTYASFSGYE